MATDFAVIGRGLMGTACARYLAEAGHSVTLIGPDEPEDRSTHDGPFGSFHDAGRITRRIAHDPVWSMLSTRSIARYEQIEADSGIRFYTPCGGVMSGPSHGKGAAFIEAVLSTSRDLDLPHEVLTSRALDTRLPMFDFADGTRAAFDPAGGVIDPRAMRTAEERLAIRAGARVIADHVTALDGTRVTLYGGDMMDAGHVVAATGAYASATPLTARPAMRAYARTVVLAEVTEADAARLADMPSLIFWPDGASYDLYLLPPILYPDGRLYLKIGGEDDSPLLTDAASARNWFRSGGSPDAAEVLLAALRRLMPSLAIKSTRTDACAVSFTHTGYPYIDHASASVTLLTGGNGAGAKCADELGRLGAVKAMGGDLKGERYSADFHAVFA